MNGIIIVNKPQGWTSFDVCNKIRHLTGIKKVGHSGTLDPMATGVLPVFLGTATRSVQYFLTGDKGYKAEMTLGIRTDTLDSTGKILTPCPCLPAGRPLSIFMERGDSEEKPLYFNSSPSPSKMEKGSGDEEGMERKIRAVFEKYIGQLMQKPPMYSAVKVKGERLYKLARKGEEVERADREIEIYKIEILNIQDDKVRFEVLCSKGTYVRVLAADIGDDLGCGAHLSALERIYSHPFHISQAIDMATIENLVKIGRLDTVVFPPEEFIPK